jgi:hypothetical protein
MFVGKQDFSDDSFVTKPLRKISQELPLEARSSWDQPSLQLKLPAFLFLLLSHSALLSEDT